MNIYMYNDTIYFKMSATLHPQQTEKYVCHMYQWSTNGQKNNQMNKPLRLTLIIGESFISSLDLYIDKCVSLNVK